MLSAETQDEIKEKQHLEIYVEQSFKTLTHHIHKMSTFLSDISGTYVSA